MEENTVKVEVQSAPAVEESIEKDPFEDFVGEDTVVMTREEAIAAGIDVEKVEAEAIEVTAEEIDAAIENSGSDTLEVDA